MDTAVATRATTTDPVPPASHTPAESAYEVIALELIALSPTPMQKLRRERFDKKAMDELAQSIKEHGVLQPVLVRPYQGTTLKHAKFELVAGERRFVASRAAGAQTIPAIVRSLTDLQALEMQVIENNQREGLHELIEAEGFEQLMKVHKLNADEIAAKIGKSRSYVYGRLKFCDLCQDGRRAFYDGKIAASIALLIARIPVPALQAAALKELTQRGRDPTYREAFDFVQRQYMTRLADAPFDPKDAKLCPAAGACTTCIKRTGNQPELFADIKSADICTDTKCFADKRDAGQKKIIAEAEAAGREVITGKAAKAAMPSQWTSQIIGYVKPTDVCYDDPKYRKYSEILGKDAPQPALLQNPHKPELIEVYDRDVIRPLLKDKLPKKQKAARGSAKRSTSSGGDNAAAVLKDRIEETARERILTQIHARHPGTLSHADLVFAAVDCLQGHSLDELTAKLFGLPQNLNQAEKKLQTLPDKDLVRILIVLPLVEDLGSWGKPQTLEAVAARLKIDTKKIRADVTAELKPKPAKADAPQPKAAAKPAKKKAAKK